ncbi:MAG: hypothetical protein Q8P25_02685 [Candidatus Curtissbacteria bacterium]|nr:hypothetical protein [Candidatus Curtissbacteria bacterium]
MNSREKLLIFANIVLYGALTVFSYAYVDLNLTISQNTLVLKFVSFMQQLGYYKRPEATALYLFWIICAFLFFIYNLHLFNKSKVGLVYLKASVFINTLILIFAYPYLSSDLFNYLFDAKIILTYHLSPYTHKPLDFPQDDWLRFMRWVHRYSPYGPLWLGFSVIPAALGFGKFILNLFLFKITIAVFHLINATIIYKFLKKTNAQQALLGTSFYALNPLFLIEGVANAHNDIVLSTFLLSAIIFVAGKQKLKAYTMLLLGILIKYIPVLLLPWVLAASLGKIDAKKTIILAIASMAIFTFLYSSVKITVPFVSAGSTQVQFQPWYLFWTLPFVAMLPIPPLIPAAIVISAGASLRHLPFLYYGDWSHSGTTNFMQLVTVIPLILAVLLILFRKLSPK